MCVTQPISGHKKCWILEKSPNKDGSLSFLREIHKFRDSAMKVQERQRIEKSMELVFDPNRLVPRL